MSERFNQDSVYGGEMTPEQWVQAEMKVECPICREMSCGCR